MKNAITSKVVARLKDRFFLKDLSLREDFTKLDPNADISEDFKGKIFFLLESLEDDQVRRVLLKAMANRFENIEGTPQQRIVDVFAYLYILFIFEEEEKAIEEKGQKLVETPADIAGEEMKKTNSEKV